MDWFDPLINQLAFSPFLQGTAIALITLIWEDPVTLGAGLLVSQEALGWYTAFFALTIGITAGDLGLFGVGRFLGGKVVDKGLVSQRKLDKARQWFDKNLVLAICVSRIVPGMRLPTYIAAGISKASGRKFLIVAMLASVVWTTVLLYLTTRLGKALLPVFGKYKWYGALGLLAVVVVIYLVSTKKVSAKLTEDSE